jgi:hypothetical protein
MAARDAFQEHTVLLELQQAVVPVKAAECLSNPVQHPFSKPFSLRRLLGARGEFVWCRRQTGEITDHGLCSSSLAGLVTDLTLLPPYLNASPALGGYQDTCRSEQSPLSLDRFRGCRDGAEKNRPRGSVEQATGASPAEAERCSCCHKWQSVPYRPSLTMPRSTKATFAGCSPSRRMK